MESSAIAYHDDDGDERTSLLGVPTNSTERDQSSHEHVHVEIAGAGGTESKEDYRSRWRSIRIMYMTMFFSSVSFSICMSSLYPYLRILDSKASTSFLGWVVASYSLGQLVASPLFGAWSNIRSRTREPLIVSLFINVLANILYMYLESLQYDAKLFLLLARTFIGFGAGNIAVVRSYVAGATTVSERTSAMANLSAFQSVGFISGNLLQTALVPLGYPGPVHTSDLHIDMYSATGLFSAFVGIINIMFLVVIFKEHSTFGWSGDTPSKQVIDSDNSSVQSRDMSPDYVAVLSSILLFFSVLFIFAVFETIITPLGMDMFAWEKAKAVLYVGIVLGCAGVVSILVFVVIKILANKFNERNILLCGFIICLLGYGAYLPWGHNYPAIQYAAIGETVIVEEHSLNHTKIPENHLEHKYLFNRNDGNYSTYRTWSSGGTLFAASDNIPLFEISTQIDNRYFLNENKTTTAKRKINNGSSAEAVGCPYYFDWCMYTPALTLWQYLLGTLFIAVGYPTCSVMSYTMYSKVLGPKPQGLWMGWLTASGSLARGLGPVFVSQVYDAYGPRVTFIAVIGIIVISILILLVIYKRLVPFSMNKQTSYKR